MRSFSSFQLYKHRGPRQRQIEDWAAFEQSGNMIWKKGLQNLGQGSDLDIGKSLQLTLAPQE